MSEAITAGTTTDLLNVGYADDGLRAFFGTSNERSSIAAVLTARQSAVTSAGV
jgi:hypothetical protein